MPLKIPTSLRYVSKFTATSHSFYREMHFSAKRGIAIACRPSVRLSVRPSVTLLTYLYLCEVFCLIHLLPYRAGLAQTS